MQMRVFINELFLDCIFLIYNTIFTALEMCFHALLQCRPPLKGGKVAIQKISSKLQDHSRRSDAIMQYVFPLWEHTLQAAMPCELILFHILSLDIY